MAGVYVLLGVGESQPHLHPAEIVQFSSEAVKSTLQVHFTGPPRLGVSYLYLFIEPRAVQSPLMAFSTRAAEKVCPLARTKFSPRETDV